MWIQIEDGRLINVDYATSVVPDHAHGKATLYGYEVLMAADSGIIYRLFFSNKGQFKGKATLDG